MADPKYANLSGIASDQPDVYETSDLPESDQGHEFYEEENDCIERLHLNATEAFSRFKDKSLSSNKVDFSDRLSKSLRTGYDARSGDWELAGAGEKETPLQRFQRLKCEMKELLEELSILKDAAKDDSTKETAPYTTVSKQVEGMLRQLATLRLEDSLGTEMISNLTDPQGAQLKKLLCQLDQFRGADEGSSNKEATRRGNEQEGGEVGVVKYQLLTRPGHAQLAQTARLTELEQRLNRLEAAVGATPAKMSRLGDGGERSLIEMGQWLSGRAAMLDAAQLEAAEARAAALTTKLDLVRERTAAITGPSDTADKVSELYELAKKSEQMAQVLPQALDRMIALQDLHQQSGEFAKSLSELESFQTHLATSSERNATTLKRVEESFAGNLAALRANMESLNARIKSITPARP